LIVVFSPGFELKLSGHEQGAHLAAIALVAVAVAMIMTPAALHRRAGAREVTIRFIRVSTRLLVWTMFPLALSLCIDFYLIPHVLAGAAVAASLTCALFAVFVFFWLILPRLESLQRAIEGHH